MWTTQLSFVVLRCHTNLQKSQLSKPSHILTNCYSLVPSPPKLAQSILKVSHIAPFPRSALPFSVSDVADTNQKRKLVIELDAACCASLSCLSSVPSCNKPLIQLISNLFNHIFVLFLVLFFFSLTSQLSCFSFFSSSLCGFQMASVRRNLRAGSHKDPAGGALWLHTQAHAKTRCRKRNGFRERAFRRRPPSRD